MFNKLSEYENKLNINKIFESKYIQTENISKEQL